MSSYLDKQSKAFKGSVVSAASRVNNANRSGLASQPDTAPSPAPSNASNTSKNENTKRKREEPPPDSKIVFSQPQITGFGKNVQTQMNFVIEHMQKKGVPETLDDILGFLSLLYAPEEHQKFISNIVRKHPSVEWVPDPQLGKAQNWKSGTYIHKPKINVRTKDQLVTYLQSKIDAQGVSVKDLKDGWPLCVEPINQLAREHKVLVTRTKKDSLPRMVWIDDPSLHHRVDDEFKTMWLKTQNKLPSVDDLVGKLIAAGQKPASEDPSKRIKTGVKTKEKKKKATRKGGKVTNTHMAHLLKDYSDRAGKK
ncbi:hypothetical protein BJ875DRAFT_449294 [Amylocarpus encephaloides]|uniref:Transcription initiation factor IIE subunit beta n=1 Tax=Amylocarpus encephaloides TaxID=45428 RepID=A0A9P7YSX9_9HELO|nr:hypothetical protein BJ875DRAFT_449294 [Amylocarpus encephaloides]